MRKMPAYAIREWRQEEKQNFLSEQITETIDSCENVTGTAKNRLKVFLMRAGIQNVAEMDYPLRRSYQEYLITTLHIQSTERYLLAYDRTKQADIRSQMQTLAGRNQCRWRLEEKILFIPYHSDQSLAMEFDSVRNRPNMVWDFTKPCAWHLKEQIFTTLNAVLDTYKVLRKREQRLSGLQYLYDFCIEEQITDIEDMDIVQEEKFSTYLTRHTSSESRKQQMLPILNFCRKTVFLNNKEINWKANLTVIRMQKTAQLNRLKTILMKYRKVGWRRNPLMLTCQG